MSLYPQLSDDEVQALAECENYYQLSQTDQWRELSAYIRELVGDAEHDLYDCLSSDPAVSHALRLTWQARKTMMQAVIGFVDARVEERQRLLKLVSDPEGEVE